MVRELRRVATSAVLTALDAGCDDDRLPLTLRAALAAGPRRLLVAGQWALTASAVLGAGLIWVGIIDSMLGLGLLGH